MRNVPVLELPSTSAFFLRPYQKAQDCIKSPFRYPGGKFYAIKHILPFLNSVHHDEFREPFVGGGSVFFAKKKCKINWINDLENDLIDIYKAFSNKQKCEELINLFNAEVATQERHQQLKEFVPSSFIEKVFRTYYLNRTSYSGIINKPAWGYRDGKVLHRVIGVPLF